MDVCTAEDTASVSHQMATWLKNASTVSVPNPYQKQIFGGGRSKGVGMHNLYINFNAFLGGFWNLMYHHNW